MRRIEFTDTRTRTTAHTQPENKGSTPVVEVNVLTLVDEDVGVIDLRAHGLLGCALLPIVDHHLLLAAEALVGDTIRAERNHVGVVELEPRSLSRLFQRHALLC
jgi:hypothetical protein